MKRPLLLPLVPVYAAALALKRALAPEPKRLRCPVVSVGSLSAGGAGKTPVVAALAVLLQQEGYAIDILSRGYGRSSQAIERVNPSGRAEQFGDEPLQLAQAGTPVYVGADRHAAGLLAEQELSGERPLHLLDDGFQHRRLARNLDIVLLTQKDVEDSLLPAGDLREPLSRLAAADIILLREDEAATLEPVVHRLSSAEIWYARRSLETTGVPQRPLAFCGIARPEGFFSMLRSAGIPPTETIAFPDHHRYREQDIARLMERAQQSQADGFVTTEKDAVKIDESMRRRLEAAGPLATARLTVEFADKTALLHRIVAATAGDDRMRR
ncbi:MAG TPA: tetraacyldisaccharide 4'-kinase [Granulicella sp.]